MPDPAPDLLISVPPDQEAGIYANFMLPWYSAHEFTLDFCVTLPPVQEHDHSPAVGRCRVVSRVRFPVTAIFDILQTINGIMTRYEDRFGPIKRVGDEQ